MLRGAFFYLICRVGYLLKCAANKFEWEEFHAVSLRNLGTKIRSQANKKTTPKQRAREREREASFEIGGDGGGGGGEDDAAKKA